MTSTSDNGYDETIYHYDPSDPQKILYWTAAIDAACNAAHDKLEALGVGDLYAEKVCGAIRDTVFTVSPPNTENFSKRDIQIILYALAVFKEECAHPEEVEATMAKLKRTQQNPE